MYAARSGNDFFNVYAVVWHFKLQNNNNNNIKKKQL